MYIQCNACEAYRIEGVSAYCDDHRDPIKRLWFFLKQTFSPVENEQMSREEFDRKNTNFKIKHEQHKK